MINLITKKEIDDSMRTEIQKLESLNNPTINYLLEQGIIQVLYFRFPNNTIDEFIDTFNMIELYSDFSFYQNSQYRRTKRSPYLEEIRIFWDKHESRDNLPGIIVYTGIPGTRKIRSVNQLEEIVEFIEEVLESYND